MTNQELRAELRRARRVIAELEKALQFVKHADPRLMYPGEEYATARTLGAAQGTAMVALCSIPQAWRTQQDPERLAA